MNRRRWQRHLSKPRLYVSLGVAGIIESLVSATKGPQVISFAGITTIDF
jgi:hypothetical protein